jgi:hypothetical protein
MVVHRRRDFELDAINYLRERGRWLEAMDAENAYVSALWWHTGKGNIIPAPENHVAWYYRLKVFLNFY